jgi:hypothetical protein
LFQTALFQRSEKAVRGLADLEQTGLAADAAQNLNDAGIHRFQFLGLQSDALARGDGGLQSVPEGPGLLHSESSRQNQLRSARDSL